MLLTLLLSPIIAGSLWPIITVLAFVFLLGIAGLWLSVWGSIALWEKAGNNGRLMFTAGLACLLAFSWFLVSFHF
jgi:hypothetical protein